ncbi:unnamed protein product [Discula destructiva]
MESSLQAASIPGPLTSTAEPHSTLPQSSPFLHPGAVAKANSLAIVQLSKDDFIPIYLRDTQGEHDGYKEGHVLNTRFGSFPHSTLIGMPWGSQVRASVVDTGTRGRKKKPAPQQKPKEQGGMAVTDPDNAGKLEGERQDTLEGLKRKRDAEDEGEKRVKSAVSREAAPSAVDNTATEQAPAGEDAPLPEADTIAHTNDDDDDDDDKTAIQADRANKTNNPPAAAQSGFVHILAPTPEIWTTSLPHRTQVVYTPDYSYILQRIRARPGTRIIEAGSGSGSFTHASARAVYDGASSSSSSSSSTGKVFSFEFHEQRYVKMRREIQEHGLSGLVEVNHRDVYNEGFLVEDGKSPEADAVFLDLPAPWLALPHLSRRKPKTGAEMQGVEEGDAWVSPLHPKKSVYICTFSPCIEQVTRTVSEMRKLGWVEIDMVEISNKRLHVFREKLGLDMVSERGQPLAPKNVAEALVKLREVEVKSAEHNAKMCAQHSRKRKVDEDEDMDQDVDTPQAAARKANGTGDDEVVNEEGSNNTGAKAFMQGQLVTRPEPEFKAHTSYLVFAIMPREWSEEDEAAAAAKWPIGQEPRIVAGVDRASRKQLKRELLESKRKKGKKAMGVDKKDKAVGTSSGAVQAVDSSAVGDVVKMDGVVQTEAS